jgi:uncharacterized MAPEG superfamily protein
MNASQRTVLAGAASGILSMILAMWGLTTILPPADAPNLADRLACAAVANAFAAVPLFVMLVTVGNGRFFSDAIDPTIGRENQRMIVDGRVADKTTQQFQIFSAATFALAVNIGEADLRVVDAAAIVFIIARLAFWIGYRIHPLYRAFGFAATAYLNLGLLAAAIWLTV